MPAVYCSCLSVPVPETTDLNMSGYADRLMLWLQAVAFAHHTDTIQYTRQTTYSMDTHTMNSLFRA